MPTFFSAVILLITLSLAVAAQPIPQPILAKYCQTCHSTAKQKGELDLERFSTIEAVKHEPALWQGVLEQLANNEMPPKGKPQLPAEAKQQLTTWVQAMLDEVALANAGDPGPIALRRLSNAEYTYTVRDLTGVESLDPAKEFPSDGAAGEGFTNAGAALVMSPALLAKYLDAAKDIASHAVLLPDGLRFSAHTSSRDWTDETLMKIRAFYAPFCEAGGATAVDLQGVKFDTNTLARLPVEKYIVALLTHREALLTQQQTLANVAESRHLNAKYLHTLWSALTDPQPSLVLDSIRKAFRAATASDASRVTQEIAAWQQSLWRFANIGHIGKKNGPKGWQLAESPLAAQHEIRIKLAPPSDGSDVTLYLCTSDAGDGHADDFALWENARLVAPGRADVPLREVRATGQPLSKTLPADGHSAQYGLDPALFGKHPNGEPVEAASLCVQAPSLIELKLPAALAKGAEFVVTGRLHPTSGPEASVQMRVLTTRPTELSAILASKAEAAMAKGQWSDNNQRTNHSAPVLINEGGTARPRFEAAFHDFRQLFPASLCYTKIVPVDEVVTLTLFYREDDQLKRLMLDEAQTIELDRLWTDLRFVSEYPLKQVDVFEQLFQFATQDASPSAFEPMRAPIQQDAATFAQQLVKVEPQQLQSVLDFASSAWRRPLSDAEHTELRALYGRLRKQDLPHRTAIRMMITRVLVAPDFLYRGEAAAPGNKAMPVSDAELATRLSYFLWSSAPDDELRALAANGTLHDPHVLAAQARRMTQDAKVRRLATEFGCQWLQVRDIETLDEKSERHFPTFASLRSAMKEEAVRFFIDLFQADRPVLSLLDADHSFMNDALAKHYGINLKSPEWQRVDSLRKHGRGGIMTFASTLAVQSGASRTSPILRGNWLSEVVLGDKLPRPPKNIPILPDEAPPGLTERQLIERHTSDAACARCHQRIDPFGFALEGFDAIGRTRHKDAAGLPIDTRVKLPDGTQLTGLDGLRAYLLGPRRDDFLRQFSRKLLGYALGRSVQLSDKPLIDSMINQLKANDPHISSAIELIVNSPQFREVRGAEFKS